MSDDKQLFDLTRRKVLGSIGALGAGAALGGAGTAAFFSDEETFENNRLVAGELDLKLDWQQTYNGPNPGNDGFVETHPVNAYPDTNADGVQDLDGVQYSGAGDIAEPVFDAADIPACCDCADDEYYLTYGGETYCIEALSAGETVENFYDYVEGGGSVQYSAQNAAIQREDTSFVFLYEEESEGDDSNLSLVFVHDAYTNEDGGSAASVTIDGAPAGSEWLTGDGDWRVTDDVEGPLNQGFEEYEEWAVDWAWGTERTDGGAIGHLADDFALKISAAFNGAAERAGLGSGHIEDLVVLSGGAGIGAGSEEILLEDEMQDDEIGPITIHSACGIESGADLPEGVFASDYYPEQDRLVHLDDVKPGDKGEITFSLHLCDNPGYVWLQAMNFDEGGGVLTEPEAAALGDGESDDGELAANMLVRIWYDVDCDNEYGDETLVFGPGIGGYSDDLDDTPATLAAAMDVMGRNDGMIPLDGGYPSPDMAWNDTETASTRDCLPPETGVCVGVEWWVPETVENEIQGDWVEFDLGFYTEQCRHNDGMGQNVTNSS